MNPSQTMTPGLVWANADGYGWNSSILSKTDILPTSPQLHPPTVNPKPEVIKVLLGANGRIEFYPETATVSPGTIIHFDLIGNNYTLISSFLGHPCSNGTWNNSWLSNGSNDTLSHVPANNFTVDYHVSSSAPQWIFCSSGGPQSHCSNSTTFHLNPLSSNHRNESTSSTIARCNAPSRTHTQGASAETGATSTHTTHGPLNTSHVLESSHAPKCTRVSILVLDILCFISIFGALFVI
jgi:hypothetical protein